MSRLRFAPAQGAGGIQELAWPRRIREGSAVVISGRLAGVARGRIRAALGERELGVTATAGDGRFALEFIAPVPGRYEIDLSVIGEADELVDRGIVPLEVAPAPRLQVLGLASSPSFGWRFFQNWLTDRDAGLVLRTRVSSEHFVEQRRNMDVSGANLSADAIDAFDIVVADLAAWRELPAAQRDLVVQAVRTDGLGLLLLAGGAAFSEGGADNVPAPRLTAAPAAPQSRLLGAEVGPLPALDLPAFGVVESVPLWQREDGIAVAGFVETGRGRIGLALRIPVYRWVTSGDARAFSLYWQRMLAAVARPKAADGRLRTSADMPYVDLRLELCLNGAVNPEMALEGPGLAGAALAMYRRPGEWCAVTWPRAAGWHRVRAGDRIHHFYVFTAREWLGVQSSERIAATRAMTEDRSAIVAVAGWRPSPPLGFGALIAIMGLLWWEQKRRPMALVKPASDGA
jgi:hypothetical protein